MAKSKIETDVPLKYAHLIVKCVKYMQREVEKYHKGGHRCIIVWNPLEVELRDRQLVKGTEPTVLPISMLDFASMSASAREIVKNYNIESSVVVEIVLPDTDGKRNKFYVNATRQ